MATPPTQRPQRPASPTEAVTLVVTLDAPTMALLRGMSAQILELKELVTKMSGTTDTIANELTSLTTDVTNETTVEASAITLINGIPALIQAAVAAAQGAGATPAQLAAFATLGQQITTSSASLAAAVTANTPAAPAAPPAAA